MSCRGSARAAAGGLELGCDVQGGCAIEYRGGRRRRRDAAATTWDIVQTLDILGWKQRTKTRREAEELRPHVRQNAEVTGALSPVANGWQTDGKYFGQGEESRLFAAV